MTLREFRAEGDSPKLNVFETVTDSPVAILRHTVSIEEVQLIPRRPLVLVVLLVEVRPVGEKNCNTNRGRVGNGGVSLQGCRVWLMSADVTQVRSWWGPTIASSTTLQDLASNVPDGVEGPLLVSWDVRGRREVVIGENAVASRVVLEDGLGTCTNLPADDRGMVSH